MIINCNEETSKSKSLYYICHVNLFKNIKHLTKKTTKVNGVIENNHKYSWLQQENQINVIDYFEIARNQLEIYYS